MGFTDARRTSAALGLALAASACGSDEKSVALIFPNEAARLATVRVVVEVFSPGSGADERDCSSFVGRSESEEESLPPIARGDYGYPFMGDQELAQVPPGRQIVFVRAFADRLESSLPILEGCTAEFDSQGGSDEHVEVPIALQVVVPSTTRLIKAEGDRQVGRLGRMLPVDLKVRMVAGEGTAPHRVPGIAVRFEVKSGDFTLVGGSSAKTFEGITDAKGEVSVAVEVPAQIGTGLVEAVAPELATKDTAGTRFRVSFAISVTEPVRLPTSRVLVGSGQRVISVGLGRVSGGPALDVVVLSCEGSAAACEPAPEPGSTEADTRPGQTRLQVYADITASASLIPIADAAALGIGASGLVVTDLRPEQGIDDIAVLNRRRADCQNRICTDRNTCPCGPEEDKIGTVCPCESSEVLILSDEGGTIRLHQRATLTATNAVTMASYTTGVGPYRNLAIAAAGRSKNARRCGRTGGVCLPSDILQCANQEECGCPPLESCECPDCVAQSQPGVCTAQDRFVDLLINKWNDSAGGGPCPNAPCPAGFVCQSQVCVPRLNNAYGCQTPSIDCDAETCTCEPGSLNGCMGMDTCGCKVPHRVFVGGFQNPRRPFSLAAGPATNATQWDLVATTDSGLELIRAQSTSPTFGWDGTPKVNAPIHGALIANFDSEIDSAGDVVWFSKRACLDGFEDTCPFFQRPAEGAKPKGCLGLYSTDGEDSIFTVRTPSRGGCRRYSLDITPTAMCVGRFNRDNYVDVALAGEGEDSLYVFAGDGRGGLLSDPDVFPLPAGGKGGPIACGDVDGDGLDDAVVVSRATGDIFVLRSGS